MKVVRRTLGVSLVEVMVTLMLLSMAAAGLVSTCAHIRSTASRADAEQAAWRLASEFSEWLRRRGDQPLGELPEDPFALLMTTQRSRECYSAACHPAEAAMFYLRDWTRRLRAQVPGARLMLCHGLPDKQVTADTDLRSCADVIRDERVVWFRLAWPRKISGRDQFSTVEFSVRRAV
ncbi:MAG: hypothetical protein RLZZ20_2742 [Pseudomonadota bacterium]